MDIKPRFIMESITLRGPPCFLQAIGPECDPKLAVASILITGWLGRMRWFWFVGSRMLWYIVVYCDIDELNMEGLKFKGPCFKIDVFCYMSWSAEMYWCLFGQQPLECLPSLPCVAHGMSWNTSMFALRFTFHDGAWLQCAMWHLSNWTHWSYLNLYQCQRTSQDGWCGWCHKPKQSQ